MKDETVKIIQKSVAKADDMTIALDYIKSALVLDCCEEIISNDGWKEIFQGEYLSAIAECGARSEKERRLLKEFDSKGA